MKTLLIAICILVASIGITCTSASDGHDNSISLKPSFTFELPQIPDAFQDQIEHIKTGKVVEEDNGINIHLDKKIAIND